MLFYYKYPETLSAHSNLLLFFDAIKEVTLCYNKVYRRCFLHDGILLF